MKKVNKSILALGVLFLLGTTALQADWYNPMDWNWKFWDKENRKDQCPQGCAHKEEVQQIMANEDQAAAERADLAREESLNEGMGQ